jgi:hypothetical protein
MIDVDDRIKKFNMAVYTVLLNNSDLWENIRFRCELIVKKCVPILMYHMGVIKIRKDNVYKMNITYRKIFRYIFQKFHRSNISALLDVFHIKPVEEMIMNKYTKLLIKCLFSKYRQMQFLTQYIIFEL